MNTPLADIEVPGDTDLQEPATAGIGKPPGLDGHIASTSVEQLIIGRKLVRPLYDRDGLIRLVEGSTITSEFTLSLVNDHVDEVWLHPEDVGNVTLKLFEEEPPDTDRVDDEFIEDLDDVVESGDLFTGNSGPPLRDRIARHECEKYHPKRQKAIIERHTRNAAVLNSMMSDVLQGETSDLEIVVHMVSRYIQDMIEDLDSVLATVFTPTGQQEIPDQCIRMALLGMAIGIELDLDEENIRRIGTAGMVHDWGMARVRQDFRSADRVLTEAEFFEIRKHPLYSLEMLELCRGIPGQVPLTSYQVHERPNGNGYPRNRTAEFIHHFAKILNVADTFRALVAPRPFRPPLKPYAAHECLLRQAQAGDVDTDVVRALLRVLSLFPIGSYIVLSDGSIAHVLRRNPNDYAKPIVRILQDAHGKQVPTDSAAAIINIGDAGLTVQQTLPTPGTNQVSLTDAIVRLPRAKIRPDETPAVEDPDAPNIPSWQLPVGRPAGKARTSLENYDMEQVRAVRRAMDIADRLSRQSGGQYNHVRKHERVAMRTSIVVCPSADADVADALTHADTFLVMARDVSQGGLSFLHPGTLTMQHVLVGLEVPGMGRQWFRAEVVRRQEIKSENVWEYGVAFRRRVGL